MGDSFDLRPLGSLVDSARGISYGIVQPGQHVANGVPVVRVTDVRGGRIGTNHPLRVAPTIAAKYRRTTLRGGELLLTLVGTVGETAIVPHELAGWNTARAVAVIPVLAEPGPLWVEYALRTGRSREYIDTRLNTTVQATLNLRDVSALPIPMPERAIRARIVDILGSLDAKIELNRRTNETLEAMARALFKSWFVDFDPVRAKADGRTPSGMDAATADLFPSELVDSEFGPIPKGWTCAPLADWATALSGGTPSKIDPSLWGGSLAWISPKVMTEIHADHSDAFVNPSAIGNGTRLAPKGATLVMVRGMGLHQQVRVSQAREDVTFNQDVKALVPKAIDASLLLFAMLNGQEDLLGRVESSGHGTGKLASEILLGHRITLPSLSEQTRFGGVFAAINDRIAAARSETRSLVATRDELLPRLLSGELSALGADDDAGQAQGLPLPGTGLRADADAGQAQGLPLRATAKTHKTRRQL